MYPKKRSPVHPGEVLNEEFLKPLSLSPQQFAKSLGKDWSEHRINAVIMGKENISPETAENFAKVLGTTPHLWLRLQAHYNQWHEMQLQQQKGAHKLRKAQ